MKRYLYPLVYITFLVGYFLTANAFVNATVTKMDSAKAKQGSSMVFIVNKDKVKIQPISYKPGYYWLKVGQLKQVSYIANAGINKSGYMPIENFLAIDWNTFRPNIAMTAHMGSLTAKRKTWLFIITGAKYSNKDGLVFTVKPKESSVIEAYSSTSPANAYDVTVFVDGFSWPRG